MDTLVFDIETQNFFTDPGVGWNNFDALKISVVCVFSYKTGAYSCFDESELRAARELFRGAERIVGFGINRYDIPVLHRYFQAMGIESATDLWQKERIDLLNIVEAATGARVSLNKLAQANLNEGKTGHGSEAIELYRRGEMEKLKAYCTSDVRLTKELYDIYIKEGALIVPERTSGEMVRVEFASQP